MQTISLTRVERNCLARLGCDLIRLVAIADFGVMLTSCSSATIELEDLNVSGEQSTSPSREYAGVGKKQAEEAAQKVLRLSGYKIFPTPESFVATLEPYGFSLHVRPPYAFWTVTVAMRQDRAVVNADLRTHYGGGTVYGSEAPTYQLFFERLDYLLKVRPKWTTCAEAVVKWPGKTLETSVRPLCFETLRSGFFFHTETLVEPDPDKLLPNTTPTPDEWLALTTRRYTDLTTEQVLDAAKKALTRSQPEFEYRDIPGGFVARVTKRHVYYVVLAMGDSYNTHFWEVRAREVPGGVLASVYVTTEQDASGGTMIGGASWHHLPGRPSVPVSGGAGVYGLFWARLENVLGLAPQWPTCEEARAKGWLPSDPICS